MKLTDFPNELPAITLDFQNSKQLDPRISFSRPSNAGATPYPITGEGFGTVNGQQYEFPPNVPRLTDQGLLIEEASTNHAGYTANMNPNWVWTISGQGDQSVITNNTAETTAPDGTNTAAKVVPNSGVGYGARLTVEFPSFITIDNRDEYDFTSSFYVKAAGKTNILWTLQSVEDAELDLAAGTVSSSDPTAKLIPVGNGWYRFSITTGGWQSGRYFLLGLTDTSGNSTDGFYVWGIQFEWEKSYPSSYIETTTASAVTRAADVVDITGVDFSSFWNPTAGTVVTSIEPIDTGRLWSLWSGPNLRIAFKNSDANIRFDNTLTTNLSGTTLTYEAVGPPGVDVVNVSTKNAVSFSTGYLEAANDGVLANTGDDDPDSMPTITAWNFFTNYNGGQRSSGYLKRIDYYPTTATTDELEALST